MTTARFFASALLVAACGRSHSDPTPAPGDEVGSARAGSGSNAASGVADANVTATGRRVVDDMAFVEAGKFIGIRLHCWEGTGPINAADVNDRKDAKQALDAFRIDRRTASCADYSSCVRAGACKATDARENCHSDVAVVTVDDAKSYCGWRSATLPSYAQWQRAVRGSGGNEFPTGHKWDADKACARPTSGTDIMRRCEQVSEAGVTYATENGNLGEWTRDIGCVVETDGRPVVGPVTPYLIGNQLNLPVIQLTRAEVRCVRDK
jgi:formylglycine-generating enzyme required for sulfatase activity